MDGTPFPVTDSVFAPGPRLGRACAHPVHNILGALVLTTSRAGQLGLKGLDGVPVPESEVLFDVFFENNNWVGVLFRFAQRTLV
jgi:hypothetical protein